MSESETANGGRGMLMALGSNLPSSIGPPRAILEAALLALQTQEVVVEAVSNWWRSPAWPPGSGPDYVNGAARLATRLPPSAVLAAFHKVESDLGRLRPRRWAARVCDLDLLADGQAVLPDHATVRAWMDLPPAEQRARVPDQLLLPHPRLHERGFVLAPLMEVAPDWRHPILHHTVRELAAALPPDALHGVARI
jgi:2-amino-4-hydroxy-6-hydroxymethyldihydropteridine diphosphokinase